MTSPLSPQVRPNLVPDDGVVLFIGDSITDCGRDLDAPDSLGDGYAAMVAERYAAEHPGSGVRFVNRGISGNRAVDLRGRWDRDCLAVGADVVSVLVGINEVWRRFDSDDPTSDEEYEDHYRTVLGQAADRGSALVLIEPFVMPVSEDQLAFRDDLDGKLAVVRRLAADFSATLVPADALMTRAAADAGPRKWTDDGIHLTPDGHALLADAWLTAVGAALPERA
ncbi:SGNH/GDSL hydrolase family protein [Streptomyces sp. NPDC088197]|uniref:SGNH/GDSL hydrolase family protein n=1 Tax=unclassified Streptomyces TaxID=2593676 RepID=UPI0036E17ECD